MNRILDENSSDDNIILCNCKKQRSPVNKWKSAIREEAYRSKKSKPSKPSERPLKYPDPDNPKFNGVKSKIFQIKYEKKLSSIAKLVLNSFKDKYLYYAIDDILYSFKSNSAERDNLLAILYSPVLSLQNNFSINFFDIWIREIYINEVSKANKFLKNESLNFEQFSYITIEFFCIIRVPIKKPDSLW